MDRPSHRTSEEGSILMTREMAIVALTDLPAGLLLELQQGMHLFL